MIERVSEDTQESIGKYGHVWNGVDELRPSGQWLVLLHATDSEAAVFEWQVLNAKTLQLIQHKDSSGGAFAGATLARDFDWATLADNTRVPRVGALSHPPRRVEIAPRTLPAASPIREVR